MRYKDYEATGWVRDCDVDHAENLVEDFLRRNALDVKKSLQDYNDAKRALSDNGRDKKRRKIGETTSSSNLESVGNPIRVMKFKPRYIC